MLRETGESINYPTSHIFFLQPRQSLPNINKKQVFVLWIFGHAQLMILDISFKKMIRKLEYGKKAAKGTQKQNDHADFQEFSEGQRI